jgi:hypothetical protein
MKTRPRLRTSAPVFRIRALMQFLWGPTAPPECVPRAYWDEIAWFRLSIRVLAVFAVALVGFYVITRRWQVPGLVFYWLFFPYYLVAPAVLRRRMRRKLAGNDFLLCPRCGYDLRQLVGERCPECGGPAKPDEVKAVWLRWLELRGACGGRGWRGVSPSLSRSADDPGVSGR